MYSVSSISFFLLQIVRDDFSYKSISDFPYLILYFQVVQVTSLIVRGLPLIILFIVPPSVSICSFTTGLFQALTCTQRFVAEVRDYSFFLPILPRTLSTKDIKTNCSDLTSPPNVSLTKISRLECLSRFPSTFRLINI